MMRRFLIGPIVLLMAVPSWGQKVETESSNRDRIIHIQTALDHLTVIEVGEPVVSVAAGSPTFKIEWRENKVFVEPTAPNVSTNLFIWTASSRFSYELSPAGPVEGMDFAIDHPKPALETNPTKPTASTSPNLPAGPSHIDSMVEDQMVRAEQEQSPNHRVAVRLDDLFQDKDMIFIRYEIRNDTTHVYTPSSPKIFLLSDVRSSRTLLSRRNSQLSQAEARRLKIRVRTSLDVAAQKLPKTKLGPGEATIGVVGVRLTRSSSTPQVLRIELPNDYRGDVSATLVL